MFLTILLFISVSHSIVLRPVSVSCCHQEGARQGDWISMFPFPFCCCGTLEMLMALEPDLYLLPEDKGIKITTTEKRQEGREQVERAEILSSSGKSFRYLETSANAAGASHITRRRRKIALQSESSELVYCRQSETVRCSRERRHCVCLCTCVMDGMCLQLGLMSPSHPNRSGRRTRLGWITWVTVHIYSNLFMCFLSVHLFGLLASA